MQAELLENHLEHGSVCDDVDVMLMHVNGQVMRRVAGQPMQLLAHICVTSPSYARLHTHII